MSMMVSFCAVPRDVLDEILNLIESVSEGFPSYASIGQLGFPGADLRNGHDLVNMTF